MTGRREFLSAVRASLGRSQGEGPSASPPGFEVIQPVDERTRRAEQVRAVMAERAGELLEELVGSAAKAGWRVHRASSDDEVVEAITRICLDANARHVLKSGEQSIADLDGLDESLAAAGVEVELAVQEPTNGEAAHRERLFESDVGITGADYAIAETGTVVVHPRGGLSRLVSLAPPRHIAVVRRGDILPSLDELFLLESEALANGTIASSMNLITGPSRTGDIEGVIVEGIHGPIEVDMVLVG